MTYFNKAKNGLLILKVILSIRFLIPGVKDKENKLNTKEQKVMNNYSS